MVAPDIKAFRTQNNLKQADLARVLGVSSSYISSVESHKGKLSQKQIQKLYKQGFVTDALFPAYARYKIALSKLKEKDKSSSFNINNKHIDALKYGRIEMTPQMVNAITSVLPELNGEWLLTGNGEMYVTKTKPVIPKENWIMLYENAIQQVAALQLLIDKKDEEIANLRSLLKLTK